MLGAFGELHLDPDRTFDALRPSLPGNRWFSVDDSTASGSCEWCSSGGWTHDDDCPYWDDLIALDDHRDAAFASHIMCQPMGQILIKQIAKSLERIELVAVAAASSKTVTDYGTYCTPHPILEAIVISDLSVSFDPQRPATIAAAYVRDFADLLYCEEEDLFHTTPHRACRMLIS